MRVTVANSVASSVVYLILLLIGQETRPSRGFAFTFRAIPSHRSQLISTRRATATSGSRLHALKTPARPPIDPNDPYANMLQNYQKKAAPIVEATPPPTPPPPPVVEDVVSSTSTSVIDTVPDAAVTTKTEAASPLAELLQKNLDAVKEATSKPMPSMDDLLGGSHGAGKAKPLGELLKKNVESLKMPASQTPNAKGLFVSPTSTGDSSFDALANAKEKFEIIRQNVFNLPNDVDQIPKDLPLPEQTKVALERLSENAKPAVDAVNSVGAQLESAATDAAAAGSAAAAGTSAGVTAFSDFMANLNLEQYGPWYVAGLALLLAASQRNSGKEEARAQYERELETLRLQADEAAGAAAAAAAGATKAKDLVAKKGGGKGKSPEMILEQGKMREIQVETEMMKKEMEKLKMDNRQLKAQLEKAMASAVQSEVPVFAASPALLSDEFDEEDEQIYDEHMTGDEDEDLDDSERIIAAIKEIDEANKAAKAKAAEEEAMIKAEIKANEATKAKAKATKGKTAATVNTAKKTSKAAAAPKEAKPTAHVAITTAEQGAHPWSSLAPSTLSRKTVAELSGFLDERGVATKDGSGKAFPKKDLLAKVKSLL